MVELIVVGVNVMVGDAVGDMELLVGAPDMEGLLVGARDMEGDLDVVFVGHPSPKNADRCSLEKKEPPSPISSPS